MTRRHEVEMALDGECPDCGTKGQMVLTEHTFVCNVCGWTHRLSDLGKQMVRDHWAAKDKGCPATGNDER